MHESLAIRCDIEYKFMLLSDPVYARSARPAALERKYACLKVPIGSETFSLYSVDAVQKRSAAQISMSDRVALHSLPSSCGSQKSDPTAVTA